MERLMGKIKSVIGSSLVQAMLELIRILLQLIC